MCYRHKDAYTSTVTEKLIFSGILTIAVTLRLLCSTTLTPFIDELAHITVPLYPQRIGAHASLAGLMAHGKILGYFPYHLLRLIPDSAFDGYSILIGARALSLLYCGLTLGVLVKIGKSLGTSTVGYLAAGIWALFPLAVFHESLALQDSLSALLTAVAILTSQRAVEGDSPRPWCGLGLILSIALLVKASNALLVPTCVLWGSVLAVPANRTDSWAKRIGWMAIGTIPVLSFIGVVLLSQWDIFWLYFSNHFQHFVTGSSGSPGGTPIIEKAAKNIDLLTAYHVGWLLLTLIGLHLISKGYAQRQLTMLVFLSIAPFLAIISASTIFPRYFLPLCIPVVVLVAWLFNRTLGKIKHAYHSSEHTATTPITHLVSAARLSIPLGVFLTIAIAGLRLPLLLSSGRSAAYLPPIDRWQYVEGWPSGFGLDILIAQLKAHCTARPQELRPTVVTHAGLLNQSTWALPLFIRRDICTFETTNLYDPKGVQDYINRQHGRPLLFLIENSYFNFDETQLDHIRARLKPVFEIQFPHAGTRFKLFELVQ